MSLEIFRARKYTKAPRYYDEYTANAETDPTIPEDDGKSASWSYYLENFKAAKHASDTEKKKHGKGRIIAFALVIFCAATLILTSLSGLLPIGNEAQIYNRLVRLHILANSDSQRDQAIKYYIRDYVVNYIAQRQDVLSDPSGSPEQRAQQTLDGVRQLSPELQAEINAKLAAMGFNYSAAITIDKEPYPTRVYGALYVPSGTYNSVRILLGSATGHNWWCVLFPPLCLAGAQTTEAQARADLEAAGYTDQQIDLLTQSGTDGKYVVRFKILEWFEELKDKIAGK